MIETFDSSYKLTKIAKENGITGIQPADTSNVELAGKNICIQFKFNRIR